MHCHGFGRAIKMGDPQVAMGFNPKKVRFGGSPIVGNLARHPVPPLQEHCTELSQMGATWT